MFAVDDNMVKDSVIFSIAYELLKNKMLGDFSFDLGKTSIIAT